MTRTSATILQAAIVLLGTAILAFLLGEPLVEGRNAHATLFQVYFNDAFLACAYLAAIPFFIALSQAFNLLGDAGRGAASSPRSINALRIIKYCAIVSIGFVLAGAAYLFIVVRGTDDIAGGISMCTVAALVFAASAMSAARFERVLQPRS